MARVPPSKVFGQVFGALVAFALSFKHNGEQAICAVHTLPRTSEVKTPTAAMLANTINAV